MSMARPPDPIDIGCCLMTLLAILVIGALVLGWLGSCMMALAS